MIWHCFAFTDLDRCNCFTNTLLKFIQCMGIIWIHFFFLDLFTDKNHRDLSMDTFQAAICYLPVSLKTLRLKQCISGIVYCSTILHKTTISIFFFRNAPRQERRMTLTCCCECIVLENTGPTIHVAVMARHAPDFWSLRGTSSPGLIVLQYL
jgi:hypothetical protein